MSRHRLQQHMRALQAELHTLQKQVALCSISPPGMRRRMLVLAIGFVAGYVAAARTIDRGETP